MPCRSLPSLQPLIPAPLSSHLSQHLICDILQGYADTLRSPALPGSPDLDSSHTADKGRRLTRSLAPSALCASSYLSILHTYPPAPHTTGSVEANETSRRQTGRHPSHLLVGGKLGCGRMHTAILADVTPPRGLQDLCVPRRSRICVSTCATIDRTVRLQCHPDVSGKGLQAHLQAQLAACNEPHRSVG